MNITLAPAPVVQWAENESTGYRHIGVLIDGKKVFAVVSHKVDGTWNSSVVPMGYSYSKDEMEDLTYFLFNDTIIDLMSFIETDATVTHDDVTNYVNSTFNDVWGDDEYND